MTTTTPPVGDLELALLLAHHRPRAWKAFDHRRAGTHGYYRLAVVEPQGSGWIAAVVDVPVGLNGAMDYVPPPTVPLAAGDVPGFLLGVGFVADGAWTEVEAITTGERRAA